ncbi:hypothetical protein CWI37_1020p0010 [Hamiltosporidium tvaerminnensis]|uniref:Chitinase n=2 Tax=Hamiltosporidium TaxID=1176354 RepID=A0A4Q9L5U3_9MICR|nr:hypothetical protein LUQ84_002757 [Hamiltosporidium tvaerminnensis]TBU00395.1 hypothetical protein CWI37_1020p0010 [Hamiltosporidium tvaerminnensis]TBU02973.1 hypothetical protein CWI36_1011p0010 [Hamiltosporidium magnivora]TBU08927.1 hypothetical protein CWI39_0126p0030 [Hamiltosporidium magnivora]
MKPILQILNFFLIISLSLAAGEKSSKPFVLATYLDFSKKESKECKGCSLFESGDAYETGYFSKESRTKNTETDKIHERINAKRMHDIDLFRLLSNKLFFIYDVLSFLGASYDIHRRPHGELSITTALRIIYEEMYFKYNEMILFLAHALHNTGNFRHFVNEKDTASGKYKSRGLLQIRGEQNYKLLNEISQNIHTNFEEYPEELGKCDSNAIKVTIGFWNLKVEEWKAKNPCKIFGFKASMDILRPIESSTRSRETARYEERYNARLKLYANLSDFFGTYFLP